MLSSSGAAMFRPAPPHPPDPTEAAWVRMEKRRRTLKRRKKSLVQLFKVEEEKEPRSRRCLVLHMGAACTHQFSIRLIKRPGALEAEAEVSNLWLSQGC